MPHKLWGICLFIRCVLQGVWYVCNASHSRSNSTVSSLSHHLSEIQHKIDAACNKAGRSISEVTLVAVTKTHSIETIEAAYDLGLRDFGENRVQELVAKQPQLPSDIRWHMIGPLQSNKVKQIIHFVHLVHSVHTESTAKELAKQALKIGRKIELLIEINISNEPQKHGLAPNEARSFLERLNEESDALLVRGLMGVASYEDDPELVRPQFRMLRELRDELKPLASDPAKLDQLSMGMTNDFEVAIEEGSTLVRIGSGLFGERAAA
jgi:PLP dependent protein